MASAEPARTMSICWLTAGPMVHTISSGYPSGLASRDHSRKRGFRTMWISFAEYELIMYAPVAGIGWSPTALGPTLEGVATANGSASLSRKSGSAAVRWNVTVPAEASVTIPVERSHRLPMF